MSKQIDTMPCDFCKPDCRNADLRVETKRAYSDGKVAYVTHTLSCKHERECSMQREMPTVQFKFSGSCERLAKIIKGCEKAIDGLRATPRLLSRDEVWIYWGRAVLRCTAKI